MKLPSKNIIPIVIACVIALTAIIIVVVYPAKSKKPANPLATLGVVKGDLTENTQREADSDNDGLKDWEEILWKTDAHKTDTDGDGTSDGKEVEEGRNPALKGPKDKVETVVSSKSEANVKASTTPTFTSKVAEKLFQNYLTLKQAGQAITPEMQDQLIQSTLLSTSFNAPTIKTYLATDIKIINDKSNAALITYANKMGAILKRNAVKGSDTELAIVTRATAKSDKKEIAKLDPIIESYKKIVAEIKATPVPVDLAYIHLDLLNAFNDGLSADQLMRNVFVDAASAMAGLKQYENAALSIVKNFQAVSKYYADQSILFTPTDDGYRFVHMVDTN